MGRTLHTVLPNGMSDKLLKTMGEDRTGERGSVVHIESGKRIYQAYSELEIVDALDNPTTLAGHLYARFSRPAYAEPFAFYTLGGAGGQSDDPLPHCWQRGCELNDMLLLVTQLPLFG